MIRALDKTDTRSFSVAAAGPAALMISKLHKMQERLTERTQRRVDDKDALDILRLLQAIPTQQLAGSFAELLKTDVAIEITKEALGALKSLFADPRATGPQMAVRASRRSCLGT